MEVTNTSLYITPVTCHMCGEKHIPFWSLQRRTMVTDSNIFGIYQYKKALAGKEHCNYNLVRVTICPNCYFASGHTNDFISESSIKKDLPEPFNKEPIVEKWLASIPKRYTLIEPYLEGLFGEMRSPRQALLSYDLAILSCSAIMKVEEAKSEKARNYAIGVKSAFYMLIKAELLMGYKKGEAADKLAKSALAKLTKIYPYLQREHSVKAGFLTGMLGLYFDIPKVVGQSYSFLQEYDKLNKVRLGTDEHKVLVSSKKKFTEAYQSRAEFSRQNLKGFNKPFEF